MSVQAMTSTVYYIMCKTRSAKYLLSLTERGAAALHTSYYPPGTGGTIGTIHLLRNHFLWGGGENQGSVDDNDYDYSPKQKLPPSPFIYYVFNSREFGGWVVRVGSGA